MSNILPRIAFAAMVAIPFMALGSAFHVPAADPCPTVEVTGSATVQDWQDVQLDAELETRNHGCVTIKAVRG